MKQIENPQPNQMKIQTLIGQVGLFIWPLPIPGAWHDWRKQQKAWWIVQSPPPSRLCGNFFNVCLLTKRGSKNSKTKIKWNHYEKEKHVAKKQKKNQNKASKRKKNGEKLKERTFKQTISNNCGIGFVVLQNINNPWVWHRIVSPSPVYTILK